MKPTLCYLICTTQRAGTHLLNEALRTTGLAGNPGEWLEPEFETGRHHLPELLPDKPDEFLDYLYEKGTGPNGVFGCNAFWWGCCSFEKYVGLLEAMPVCDNQRGINALNEIFPKLQFIHLIRRNKIRQAISSVKAQQTKVYSQWRGLAFNENEREPEFIYEDIKESLNFAIKSEECWNQFFLTNGIEPLQIIYEDLAENFEETALAVLDFLGIEYPPDLQFEPRYLLKQADHINDEWEQMFLAMEAKLKKSSSTGEDSTRTAEG